MAHSFNVNLAPSTGAIAIFDGLLKSAEGVLDLTGWTRPKDSDGTDYSSSGVQLTTGASGPGGLGNANAWFVIEDPNGIRQLMFQRKANNQIWTIKYSKSAKFTGGTPDFETPATATDEETILDNSYLFTTSDGGYRFHAIGGDSTVGYSFDFFGYDIGDPAAGSFEMMLDVMKTGSFDPAQADPAVIYLTTNAAGAGDFVGTAKTNGFILDGVETWSTCYPFSYYSENTGHLLGPATTGVRGSGTDPWSGKDTTLPIIYGQVMNDARPAVKGQSSLCKYAGTYRNIMDTINLDGGTKNAIYRNGRILPWAGIDPTI